MKYIGIYSIPIIILTAAICIMFGKGKVFDEFIKGCKEGLDTTVKLLPTLIILVSAVKMFSASGALDIMCGLFSGVTSFIGIPSELLPLVVTRPVSGSASTALISNLYAEHGADSFVASCASVFMGCTDTIIYTLAMYFGAVGVTKTRYALPASFLVMIFALLCSVAVTKMMF